MGKFLYSAAVLTRNRSWRKSITLSLSVMLFNKLQEKCREHLDDSDIMMVLISSKMHAKFNNMREGSTTLSCRELVYLDPCLFNNFIRDSDNLHRHVTTLTNDNCEPSRQQEGEVSTSILDEIFNNNSVSFPTNDEVSSFLGSTIREYKSMVALE